MRRNVVIGAAVCLLAWVLFWPARRHEFVNYDDPLYVTANPEVQAGLTAEGAAWAFGRLTGEGTYWHPLTWLSHMLDCEWAGLDAGKHHLTSVLIHGINAALLFFLLRQLTGSRWRSAVTAALFACHPLQVDSAAWIAERKNLLSLFFGLPAMAAYAVYARTTEAAAGRRRVWYAAALGCFALSLMCKPALVTLPCLLLVLDFWPLRRFSRAAWPALLREKTPFFLLSAASSAVIVLAHRKLELVTSAEQLPWASRLCNALAAYAEYIRKALWPNDLSVYYPMPDAWPAWRIAAAAALVAGISAAAVLAVRKHPYGFTGWFWFLGTLVPFIGLIQVNDQAMADRFAYFPLIGLLLAAVWTVSEAAARLVERPDGLLAVVAAVVLAGLFAAARVLLSHWRNSETIFRRSLVLTGPNNIAHINLGAALEEQGRLAEAEEQYRKSLAVQPANSMAESNLGVVLAKTGRLAEALPHFERALEINPKNADAHSNLGLARMHSGKSAEAETAFREALRRKPGHAGAAHNLANLLAQTGRAAEALPYYETARRQRPGNPDIRNDMGRALMMLARHDEAAACFSEALALRPDHAQARLNLGIVLLKTGRNAEAGPHLQEAARLQPAWRKQIEGMLKE